MTTKQAIESKARNLIITADPNNRASELAKVAADPVVRNVLAADVFLTSAGFGQLDLSESVKLLRKRVEVTNSGDLKHAETMLVAQAATLDAIFTNLARRAAANMGEYIGAAETYMRLALKAQAQCRATLETLVAIKNPPVIFAKQANIAHGHQQVNNDATVAHGETENTPTELLGNDYEKRLDNATLQAPIASNSPLETVAAIHRPSQHRRKGDDKP